MYRIKVYNVNCIKEIMDFDINILEKHASYTVSGRFHKQKQDRCMYKSNFFSLKRKAAMNLFRANTAGYKRAPIKKHN